MWGAVLNSESKQGEDGRMKGVACGEKKHMGASGRACQGACAAASCLLPISTCSILACWSLLSSACAKINDIFRHKAKGFSRITTQIGWKVQQHFNDPGITGDFTKAAIPKGNHVVADKGLKL
jgi:hypothetical protein